MTFVKLDDSPMFRQQLQGLEEGAEALRGRCSKFYKGCWKYTEGLGEAYDGEIAFATALETFGGLNDPIFAAMGGHVMTKLTIALRQIGTYKEVLRSQVEHMLNDRLLQLVNIDLQYLKEARKHFDKTSLIYDQDTRKLICSGWGIVFNLCAPRPMYNGHNKHFKYEQEQKPFFDLLVQIH